MGFRHFKGAELAIEKRNGLLYKSIGLFRTGELRHEKIRICNLHDVVNGKIYVIIAGQLISTGIDPFKL